MIFFDGDGGGGGKSDGGYLYFFQNFFVVVLSLFYICCKLTFGLLPPCKAVHSKYPVRLSCFVRQLS